MATLTIGRTRDTAGTPAANAYIAADDGTTLAHLTGDITLTVSAGQWVLCNTSASSVTIAGVTLAAKADPITAASFGAVAGSTDLTGDLAAGLVILGRVSDIPDTYSGNLFLEGWHANAHVIGGQHMAKGMVARKHQNKHHPTRMQLLNGVLTTSKDSSSNPVLAIKALSGGATYYASDDGSGLIGLTLSGGTSYLGWPAGSYQVLGSTGANLAGSTLAFPGETGGMSGSAGGAIVLLSTDAPGSNPGLSTFTGTLPANTYYFRYCFTRSITTTAGLTQTIESGLSGEASIATSGTQNVTITMAALPSGFTGYNVYMGTLSGHEALVASTTSSTLNIGTTSTSTYPSYGFSAWPSTVDLTDDALVRFIKIGHLSSNVDSATGNYVLHHYLVGAHENHGAHHQDNSVTQAHIGPGAVHGGEGGNKNHIGTGAVQSVHMGAASVLAAAIGSSQITQGKINLGAGTTTAISLGQVTIAAAGAVGNYNIGAVQNPSAFGSAQGFPLVGLAPGVAVLFALTVDSAAAPAYPGAAWHTLTPVPAVSPTGNSTTDTRPDNIFSYTDSGTGHVWASVWLVKFQFANSTVIAAWQGANVDVGLTSHTLYLWLLWPGLAP